MEVIGTIFQELIKGMQHEFTIYGYDISWWQIFIFTIVASIICALIGGFFSK